MNCTDVRAALPLLIYGEPTPQEAALREHLAGCAACRREYEAMQDVRRLLDTTTVPPVEVNLTHLHRTLAERQLQAARRWRRIAVAVGGVAALLLLVLGLRLEVRLEVNQLVVRWGNPQRSEPAVVPVEKPPVAAAQAPLDKPDYREDLRVISDLIHALKEDVEDRDQRLTVRLNRLQGHVRSLKAQSDLRWSTTEQDVAALYLLSRKGDQP